MTQIEIPAVTPSQFGKMALELFSQATGSIAAWQQSAAFEIIAQGLASGELTIAPKATPVEVTYD